MDKKSLSDRASGGQTDADACVNEKRMRLNEIYSALRCLIMNIMLPS